MAKVLGYDDRRHVWPWFNTDRRLLPEHCPTIERATRKAGDTVLCEELRPDLDWSTFRERTAEEWKRAPKVGEAESNGV